MTGAANEYSFIKPAFVCSLVKNFIHQTHTAPQPVISMFFAPGAADNTETQAGIENSN